MGGLIIQLHAGGWAVWSGAPRCLPLQDAFPPRCTVSLACLARLCSDAAEKDEPDDAADGGLAAAADHGITAEAAGAPVDSAADAAAAVAAALRGLPQHVPVQYDRLGRELQKWIQCNKCEKWRKVPYGLDDGDIPEEWQVSSRLPACLPSWWAWTWMCGGAARRAACVQLLLGSSLRVGTTQFAAQ